MNGPGGKRLVTADELAQLLAAWRDPDYRARAQVDAARAGMVEVDNPMRRELRARRGTDGR